jgi:hypothetical protein
MKRHLTDRTLQHALRQGILPTILEIQQEEKKLHPNHHPNFAARLTVLLVWAGARKSTLPNWEYLDERCLMNFIDQVNQLHPGHFPKIVVVEFTQVYSTSETTSQRVITGNDNSNHVFNSTQSPVTDTDLGHEFGFYPPNVTHFAHPPLNSKPWAHCVHEFTSNTLIFAEIFFPDSLPPIQIIEFHEFCENRIKQYNNIMEQFCWPFRFRGSNMAC